MTAKLDRQHSTYRVTFKADPVEIVFDHLRNGRDSLVAEVDVLTSLPSFGPLLRDGQLNILSETTQRSWAKGLSHRCAAITDWEGILMEACRLVKKAYRDGEPSVALSEIERPPHGSWAIPGLVLARLPVVLFGDGSSGKSLLALAIAESLQSGQSLPGLGLKPSREVNVLWLDYEYDGWEHTLRSLAMGVERSAIRYRRMDAPLCDAEEAIEKEIDRHNIGIIVIDSAAMACGGKPEDSEQTNRLFQSLRRFDRGAIVIAHETKSNTQASGPQWHDKPFGSAYWHDNARATWFVQKQQDEQGEDEAQVLLHVGVFNKKTNQGRLWKPLGWRVEITNNDQLEMIGCTFAREDVRDIEGLRVSAGLRANIRRVLESGAMTTPDIARELDAKPDSIRKTCERMLRAAELVVVDQVGPALRYGLAARRVDLSGGPYDDLPF